jgi:hypothetical protein
VVVFEVMKTEVDLLELCKRQWGYGGKVALSSRQFSLRFTVTLHIYKTFLVKKFRENVCYQS